MNFIKEEIHEDGIRFDPNRDFAYNVQDNECMLTATGIVINHIYNKYLIQAAISFHGGDNSISIINFKTSYKIIYNSISMGWKKSYN